ncbi:MAG: hypothetical protein IMW91_11065 [Firmicutes bacterium]|nr:hypothetical protein [Bacillota bacterium]
MLIYTIFHQSAEGIDAKTYESTLRALYEGIQTQAKALGESIAVEESIFDQQELPETLAPLAEAATQLLSRHHFAAPSQRPIYWDAVQLSSYTQLGMLEQVVRDRMGIYTGPHGQHLQEFSATTFNLYESKFSIGEPGSRLHGQRIGLIFFNKPISLKYDDFREALLVRFQHWAKQASGEVTLWQRSLGLGRMPEFFLTAKVTSFQEIEALLPARDGESLEMTTVLRKGALLTGQCIF